MKQVTNCWNKIIFPKAGYIACLTLWKKTLISDMVHKFNRSHIFQCVSCSESVENVDHLFFHCSFAQQCWNFVVQNLSLKIYYNNLVLDGIFNLKVIHIKSGDF